MVGTEAVELVSGREAARRLGVSLDEVRALVEAGELTGRKQGRGLRVEFPAAVVAPSEVFADELQEYWCGTLPGCPQEHMSLFGIEFQSYSEEVSDPTDGSRLTRREKKVGKLLQLDEEQVRGIEGAIGRKVVRKINEQRSVILSTHDKQVDGTYTPARRFRRLSTDQPLADFVYLIPVGEAVDRLGAMWRSQTPPSLSAA